MEDDDDDELATGLESSDEHADLDEHGEDDEEVVAGDGRVIGVEPRGEDDRGQHESTEETRPRLFDSEGEELPYSGGDAGENAVGEGVEDCLESSEFAAISHLLKYPLPKI